MVVEAVNGEPATFHGELNPGKTGGPGIYEVDTYEFLYRQSATECEGGSTAPESPGISLGGGQEVLPPVEVGGLRPNSEYTVCLLVRNEAGETALGQSVTFKTELVAPVLGEAWVSDVASSSATFNAQVNPGGRGNDLPLGIRHQRSVRVEHTARRRRGRVGRRRGDGAGARAGSAAERDLPCPCGRRQRGWNRRQH